MKLATRIAAAAIAAVTLCLIDFQPLPGLGPWIWTAEARIGRPATPLSYAGGARRTTRRTVAYGAAVAANGCRTYYNAYGVATCY